MLAAILTVRLLATSQVLLFAVSLGLSKNPRSIRFWGVLLAVSVIAFLIIPLIEAYTVLKAPLIPVLFAQAIPLFLLLFTWEIFEDAKGFPAGAWFLGSFYLVGSAWFAWRWDGFGGAEMSLPAIALQLGKLGFALAAVYVVWRGREYDLVEKRLKFRRVFATGLAAAVALVAATELMTGWKVPQAVELAGMAAIFALTLALNLAFMNYEPVLVFAQPGTAPPQEQGENPLIGVLSGLMEEERLYAEHSLRIADVAGRLNLPEYQLRRLINQQLKYRNFNQFVNRYRIDEATERLLQEPSSPILTIALDVGFRSISSFNDAFRLRHGCSPTVYRNGRLAGNTP